MNSITLPVHSFVDLITNSSTEIYVAASDHTVETLKKLINCLLKTATPLYASSYLTADDLFEFTLGELESGGQCDYPIRHLTVKAKTDYSGVVEAAAILNDLTGLFSINAEYNG